MNIVLMLTQIKDIITELERTQNTLKTQNRRLRVINQSLGMIEDDDLTQVRKEIEINEKRLQQITLEIHQLELVLSRIEETYQQAEMSIVEYEDRFLSKNSDRTSANKLDQVKDLQEKNAINFL